MEKNVCSRIFCWLLIVTLSGCGLPKTYRGDQIKPELPISVGDEVLIRHKNADEPVRIIVTGLSREHIEGELVDVEDETTRLRWQDITEIKEPSPIDMESPTFWLVLLAALIIAKQAADGMDDMFDAFFD